MTRRANSSAPPYDSDASYSPEDDDVEDELFDRNGSDHSESETEATDVEDLSLDDDDGCDDIDVDDQVQFFGGNIHPPEYYRHAVESFNESAYETQDYSDGSLLLLDACEEQWRQYATRHTTSFCLLAANLSAPRRLDTAKCWSATLKAVSSLSRSLMPCPSSITFSTGHSIRKSARTEGRGEELGRAAPWARTGKSSDSSMREPRETSSIRS